MIHSYSGLSMAQAAQNCSYSSLSLTPAPGTKIEQKYPEISVPMDKLVHVAREGGIKDFISIRCSLFPGGFGRFFLRRAPEACPCAHCRPCRCPGFRSGKSDDD